MFSSFGQATQNPSPGSNPFATKPSPFAQKPNPFATGNTNASNVTEQNGRGTHSDGEGKRKKAGGFRDDEAHLSDSGRSKKKRGDDGSKQNRDNGSKRHKDTRPRNATSNSHAEAVNTDASGIDSDDITTGTFQPTNDPRAIQVYTQLRKDGINPPNWPSQPGNPNNKVAMAKFRERYEQYRQKVRASLVKSGLIDDPSKRKNLSDAIDFKGICEDMCPEYEKITRITEIDVHQPEKDPNTGYAVNAHMVKKLARSAAGQEAPLPMDVRSAATLQRTMDYLIDDLLQDDDNLPGLHGFLWDRTRAIRRDFTFFSSLTPDELKAQVYVLENITRFHVTSLHLLSEEGNRPEDFVEQQELEQLGKALLSLRDLYDDCNGQGIQCENEAEFRAYYLIFHGSDPNIIEILQRQWRPSLWKDSDEIRTAVSLVEALQNTKDFHGPLKEAPSMSASAGYHTYFRIVEDSSVSYTMACFAECHFARLRRNLLESIARALARPKDAAKDVTAADLNRCLRFDTVDEAISFAELHDLSFQANEDHPEDPSRRRLLLSLGKQLPHHRLQHHFSEALVEAKRGSHSLPDVIHKTVFADGTVAKGNVFKADQNPQSSQQTSFKPAQGGSNTSISTVKPQGAFGGSTNNGVTAATNPFQSQAQPATSTQQPPPPATNPFSSGTTQAPGQFQKPATNPFASTSGPGTSTPPFTFGGNGNSSWKKPSSAEESTGPGSFTSKLSTDTGEKPFFGAASNGAKPEQPAEPEKPKPNPFTSQPPQLLAGTKPAPGAGGLLGQAPLPSAQPSGGLLQPKAPTFGFPSQAAPTTAPQSEQWSSQNAASSGSVLPSAKPFPSFPPSNTQPGTQGGSLNQANSSLDIQQAASLLPQPPQRTTTPSVSPPARLSQPVQGLPSAQVPVPPAVPTSPPRDRMADFTRWFVTGDNGLLDEFRTFMVENILSKVYDDYVRQQREEAQKEEEESLAAEAEAFRVYNTQLKFFYRWKRNARQKRMRFLRLQGREKQRQYYQSQREAEQRMSKEASLRKAKQRAELSLVDRPAEFSTMLTSSKKRSRTETEDALVASGVLDGMVDERRVARRIVSREYTPASERPSSGHSASHSTMTSASKKSGGKTAALREKFFGDKSVGFRKSMPSMSISSEPPHSRSRVSDRWRLKAMGIVKLPDGTAVPESMANDMMRRGRAFPGWSPGRKTSNPLSRRGSAASDVRPTVERSSSHSRAFAGSLLQKRKRPAHDEEGEEEGGGRGNRGEGPAKPHKRVVSEGGEELSETYRLIAELREMRGELEEGTQWFREQNDRMQSETRGSSRGHTPWDESVL